MKKIKEIKKEDALEGSLVFLTINFDAWLKRTNPKFNIPMANRMAKVIKVFDWKTEEGKILLKMRQDSGKWGKLNPEDFKYILKIFYPDLITQGSKKAGMVAEEVCPMFIPGTKAMMFDKVPDWMIKDIVKKEKNVLKVEKKTTDVPK